MVKATVKTALYLFLGAVTTLTVPIAQSGAMSEETRKLAFCSGVLPYGINVALMSNNEGMAKVLSMQGARVNAALFVTNVDERGTVPGELVASFNQITEGVKPKFDKNPQQLNHAIDDCSALATYVIKREMAAGATLFGKPLMEVIIEMNKAVQQNLGL